MFVYIFNYLTHLFCDCSKYQSEPEDNIEAQDKIERADKTKPECKEINVKQQTMYHYYTNNSLDPLWQDRRMMSFFQVKNKK
jgi:hypothetical protein